MVSDNTPKQSGSIIFWKGDSSNVALNLPAEGSGESAKKTVAANHSVIEMSDIPSASTITLNYRTAPDDEVVRSSITLRTTHRPASLNRTEYSYLLNTYAVGDFVSSGLGLKVIAKKEGPSPQADVKADHQMDCYVTLSSSPPSA
ncbi:hypothetical protein [Pseudomonas sp. JR33AA]|uniref:hypothetical protein n=1 Tax=Pseudomonas sp. JR33AA TaxID=2899113 RepID=UPI001F1CBC8C|nr:hypothetical protein [Pseudomonas sp. JR33AA]MCE5979892.1 hypothetical protein [Pseudomonas sp. JR33AA]